MRYALILRESQTDHALLKTENIERLEALALLARAHVRTVRPGTLALVCKDRAYIEAVPMHPDRLTIIHQLREAEFPLPENDLVIEGEFTRC